jgi:carbonic anhydrase
MKASLSTASAPRRRMVLPWRVVAGHEQCAMVSLSVASPNTRRNEQSPPRVLPQNSLVHRPRKRELLLIVSATEKRTYVARAAPNLRCARGRTGEGRAGYRVRHVGATHDLSNQSISKTKKTS